MKKWFLIALAALTLASGALADGYASYGYAAGDGMGAASVRREAVVVSRSVTIRSGMSTGSSSVGTASNGQRLTILDDSDPTWLRVRKQGDRTPAEGYVLRAYVVAKPLTLVLRRSNTPAYAAPARGSKQVGSLSAYTELPVIGTFDEYYVVNLREASAFIARSADVFTSAQIESMFAAPGVAVTLRRTQGYSGPSDRWAKADLIPAGEQVEIARGENGWTPVRYKGKVQYVPESELTVTRAVRGTAAAQPAAQQGMTITLPRVSGVTLTYWAVPEADSRQPAAGTITIAQATECAVQELTRKYALRRRDLTGFEIHYSYRDSARTAYGVNAPYWSVWFWAGEEEGILWDVDVNARTGAILYSAGVDDGNG